MDKKRIGVKKIMSLGNWLANKILIPEADLIDEFLITHDLARIINEGNSVTTAVGMEVDDGPKMYHKSYSRKNRP